MRFMCMMKTDADSESGRPPDPKLMAAVQAYTEPQLKAGTVLATGGLAPSSQGKRLKARDGKLELIDGPFAETKELLAGFAIIEASSLEDAIEQGKRWMGLHFEVLGSGYEGELEIRQVYGVDDVTGPGTLIAPCPGLHAER